MFKRTSKSIISILMAAVMLLSAVSFAASPAVANIIPEITSDGNSYYYGGQTINLEDGSTFRSEVPFRVSSEAGNIDLSELGEVTDELSCDGYIVRKITDQGQLEALFGDIASHQAANVKINKLDPEAYNKEVVKVIVELEDEALSKNEQLNITLGSVIDAELYAKMQSKMLDSQNKILGIIARQTAKKGLSSIANYFITINGFAVEIEREHIETINSIKGVKIAFESPVFEVSPNEVFNSGAEQQGTYQAWTSGYRGEGMAVAIIDTGLYLAHRAFANAPENAKYSADDIAALLETYDFQAEGRMASFNAAMAYHSAKAPFVFDYSQNDADVNHTNNVSAHGTHVAGIIAADEEFNNSDAPGVVGVAPEAQLVIFKVFSSDGAYFTDVISAMEDAILLGVDAVNLSLGSPAGADYEPGMTEVFDAANAIGINVVVSAGNETSSANGNRWGNNLQLASNPDKGVVCVPGSFASNMTVASVNSLRSYNFSAYYLYYGRDVVWGEPYEMDFYDPAPIEYKIRSVLGGQKLPFVIMEDYNFDAYDLEGKLVIVLESEEIATQELYDAAVAAGAAGMVVAAYNEDDDWAYDMEIESFEAMPCVTCMNWNLTDLQIYANDNPNDHFLTIPTRYEDTVDGGEMSDFSSWGATQDLRLKPEISAVGGAVYSTWNYNSYAEASGTSMSAPQVAGAALLVKQYLKAEYPEMTSQQMHNVANAILMSTASQVTTNGLEVSPRNQGAGLVNIDKAVNATAYLTVDGCDKPKIELGDDPDTTGVYELSFNVVNMADVEKTYTIDVVAITERAMSGEIREGEPIYFMYNEPYRLMPSVTGDTSVTVPANSTAAASVTITLSAADIAYFEEHYVNGAYVEGFIKLIDNAANGMNLSLPYLGFYGDWTKLSLLDVTFGYDTLWETPVDLNYSSVMPHMALTTVNGEPHYLGDNMATALNPTLEPYGYFSWDDIRCYISPNGDGIADGIEYVYTSLLRNASLVTYKITNTETGEVYYEKSFEYYNRYTQDENYNQIPMGMDEYSMFDPWYGTDAEGNPLPDGTEVYVSIDCEMEYRGETVTDNALDSWGFLCCIDTGVPEVSINVNQTGSGNYAGWNMSATVKDDGIISDCKVIRGTLLNGYYGSMMSTSYSVANTRGIDGFLFGGFSAGRLYCFNLFLRDYAGNIVAYQFDSREPGASMINLDCASEVYLFEGETLDVEDITDHGGLQFNGLPLIWSNEDETVASVESTGEKTATITALSTGDTLLTVTHPNCTYGDTVLVHVVSRELAITATAGDNGTITPAGTTNIAYGEDLTYTITANEGYLISDVLIDGVSVGAVSEYTFTDIAANHTIDAQFAAKQYQVIFVDSITSEIISIQMIDHGADAALPEAPIHDGYDFSCWTGTYTNITSDRIITAYYIPSLMLGDVDLSGEVTFIDALHLLRYSLGIIDLDEPQLKVSDANCDGFINSADSVIIMRYALGLITEL